MIRKIVKIYCYFLYSQNNFYFLTHSALINVFFLKNSPSSIWGEVIPCTLVGTIDEMIH